MTSDRELSEMSEAASARGGLLNGAATVLGAGLAFAMTFIVTNTWGAALTGIFFGAVAAFMIVATAMKLGAETGLVLFIARLRANGRFDQARAVVVRAVAPVAAASLVAAVAMWFGAGALARVFADDALADDFEQVVRVLAFFVPAWSISLCLLGATRGAGTMVPTSIGLQFLQPGAQCLLVSIAAATDASLTTVAWAWATPIGATLFTAVFSVARLLPRADLRTVDHGSTTPDLAEVTNAVFWDYATRRGVAGTLQMALDRVGVLLVGALASPAVAGQWAAISRLVGVAQRVFHAIGQALNPRVSALVERGNWPEVSRVADRITQWTMLVLSPVLVGLACFPTSALGLFGDDFSSAAPALRLAAIVVFGASMLAHADNVLLMAGDSRRAMVNTAAALAVAVLGYLLLVPGLEALGAAIAFGAGVVVYRLLAASQIRRLLGVGVFGSTSRNATLTALGTVAPVLVVGRLIGEDTLATAIMSGVVAAICFVVAVFALGRRGVLELSLR